MKDLTVSQVSRYLSINDPSDIEAAACYLDKPMAEVRKLPLHDIEAAAVNMASIDSIPAIFKERLWLADDGTWNTEGKGKEYGILNDWDKQITAGEYADIKEYQRSFYPNATRILSILYRPVVERYGNKYKIEEYKGTDGHEVFASMPAKYLNGVLFFFSRVKENCSRNLISSTVERLTSLAKSGGGTVRSWSLPKTSDTLKQ